MSSEERELSLCSKVEMRIALAEDDKLESVLKTYLTPLLLKLASEHASVRNKVISICHHIKIRLAGNRSIVLPVAGLLKQFKENSESPILRHFDLVFIQQSVGKLTSKEQMDLIPTILHGLSSDAGRPTCATIFNLFLRLLPQLQIPPRGSKEDSELREKLGLVKHNEDAKFVACWLGKLIILAIVRLGESGVTCPGLRVQEYEFLTLNGKKEAWDPNAMGGLNLTQTKLTALRFLSSGAFTDEERFVPGLFASGDTNSRISTIGEDMLKRSTMLLEDSEIVRNLLDIYFTLRPALQTRLLVLLAKSAVSTTFPSQVIRIVQEAIHPDDNQNVPAKGLETVKFRNALFNYMNWVSRIASTRDLDHFAPKLVGFLRSYIEDQGWPVPYEKSSDASALRALAYETLGSLAKTTPSIILEKNLSLVRWLFRSLTEEGSSDDTFVSIEGALGSLLSAFVQPLDPILCNDLRHLLLKYMTLQEGDGIIRSARFVTVRWANRILQYNDTVGRWIDILALGSRTNERSDVLEEGKKGLDPYWYQIMNPSSVSTNDALPDWKEIVNVFFTHQSMLSNSSEANALKTGMSVDSVSVFGNFPGSRINAYPSAVSFCRQMLLLAAMQNSSSPLVLGADWERQLDVLLSSSKPSLTTIKSYVRLVDHNVLYTYLTAAFEGILRNDGNGLPGCGKCFIDIAKFVSKDVIGKLSSRAFELTASIKSNNTATRMLAAQAFGILVSHPDNGSNTVQETIKSLLDNIAPWDSAFGADTNKIHGYILALGFVLSRMSYYNRLKAIEHRIIKEAVNILIEILLGAKDQSIKEAVLASMCQISASGVLTSKQLEESKSKTVGLIKNLTVAAKSGEEKSIATLGHLSIVFDEDFSENKVDGYESHVSTILANLYSLYELKQTEIQFTVGEAISCLAGCWESDILSLGLDVDTNYTGRQRRSYRLECVLQKLLKDCKATKPSLKKASSIWLFCLIQYCGRSKEIQARLRECQAAFMTLLSARDELVQETASRGLGLVYERGEKELRKSLVQDLVSSFTGTNAQLKVDEDTELFEPGALPTGEGNSVTSYKDIISLANEVGDQSLVYKFMSLASNAATWSTRAAFGRFGLSSILSESEVDPKLYPKLYRYRFDPNPNVQRSMNDIWKALVKDSTATINLHFEEILLDLLKSILGNEWRTRQASCAAIADLVQGREFDKFEKHIHEIWQVAFKVLDDIKDSVREAARSLSNVLTNILVRQVEAGTLTKHAQSMLEEVLPFLLSDQGMESSAPDVRLFATATVMRLVKSAGKSLLVFIPDLIEKLLGLLSTIEPQEINYLYQRLAEHRDKIDLLRSNAVSQSPLMEAVERCLDILDESAMKKLTPRLESSIKTMIGMPSKIGCAGVLTNLATRHAFIFRPHADIFLKAMEKAVLDRNATVSAAFSRSSGYLSRLASDEAITRLASFTQNLYFSAEDETRRQVAGEITYAVSKFATDRFNGMASDYFPFVFFAKHDFDAEVKKQFQKIWDDNVGGSRTVMLYSCEITKLSMDSLESAKWTTKHTAALTIADVIHSTDLENPGSNSATLWRALEKALALKTFDGKEKILKAFIKFTKSEKSHWQKNPDIAMQMKRIAIREAKRNNDLYRPYAYDSLGEFCMARTDLDMFDEAFNIIAPFLQELINEEKMDTTDYSKSGGTFSESSTLTAGISTLFRAVNIKHTDSSPLEHLVTLFQVVRSVVLSTKITVGTRMAIYEGVKVLFEGIREGPYAEGSNAYELALNFFSVLELQKDFGSEGMRLKRSEAGEVIAEALASGSLGKVAEGRDSCQKIMKEWVGESRDNERSPAVRAVLDRLLKVLG